MSLAFMRAQSKSGNLGLLLLFCGLFVPAFVHADKTSQIKAPAADAVQSTGIDVVPEASAEQQVLLEPVSMATTSALHLSADLVMTVDPAHVVLTQDGQVKLTIASASGKLDAENVQLFSSVGKFDAPTADDMGQVVVNYHLPTKLYPQVALLAALVRVNGTQQLGWLSVPLFGRGEMELEGKRRHKLSIKIGDQVFGPVRANRKGKATVKIEVPPGYEYGYVKKNKIPLGVVPFSRVLMLAEKPTIQAARDSKNATATRLHIFAVDKRGQPLQSAEFILETSAGQVFPAQLVKAGHYKFDVQAVAVSPEQSIKVSAKLKDSPDFVSEVSLQVLKAAPVVVAQKKEAKQPEQKIDLDWTLVTAGAGTALLAVGGMTALALESTLSLSALGSADDRELMQGSERAMFGLATVGLIAGAIGGGMYLMNNSK